MDDGISLLDALREELGCRSVKDGCSPQGQCGCCTVWVDGAPRVACVTPVRRIAGRRVTTLEGAPEELRDRWAAAFVAARRQPVRLLHTRHRPPAGRARRGGTGEATVARHDIEAALRAHLCRCTGWQSIVDAACSALGVDGAPRAVRRRSPQPGAGRLARPGRGPGLPELGPRGGPRRRWLRRRHCATRCPGPAGRGWSARPRASAPPGPGSGRVQGRNSTVPLSHPVEVPGATGPSPCRRPGSSPPTSSPTPVGPGPASCPASPLANGGAFGGKRRSPVPATAPGAGRRQRRRRARAVAARRRGAPRAQAPAPGHRSACRRHRRRPGRPHEGSADLRTAGGPRAGPLPWRRGRAGRGGRAARVVRPARRRLGRGARGTGRARRLRRHCRDGTRRGARSMSPCPVPAAPASSCMSAAGPRAGSRSTCGRARSSVR